jgi:hypothetical protein
MHVAFYAEQLYYLPQFTPVIRALLARGHAVTTIVRLDPVLRNLALPELEALGSAHHLVRVDDGAGAYAVLRHAAPEWAVFGSFTDPAQPLASGTRTALIYHGIGVKNVLFDPRLDGFDLRLVESQRVLDALLARNPALADRLALVGFAKLDPLFAAPPLKARRPGEAAVLLYAPTFYPSSLEKMPVDLGRVAPGARWIVKPHFFTWTIEKYAGQRARLAEWARDPAVEVLGPETYDLVPLMGRADLLRSDASSALFEVAALRRPVIWCRFLKLRWTYRGLLSWRFDRRMDPNTPRYEAVACCVDRAGELAAAIAAGLSGNEGLAADAAREALVEHLIGPRDGHSAARIVAQLEQRAPG